LLSDPNVVQVTSTGVVVQVPSSLVDGSHRVSVRAADTGASYNMTSWSFLIDANAPELTITSPTASITNSPTVTVAGRTEPGVSVTVGGTPVPVTASGGFSLILTLAEGPHSLVVVAKDAGGNTATATVAITIDRTPPAVSLAAPASGSTVNVASVRVSGTTEPGAALLVNGIGVTVGSDGGFSLLIALAVGSNTITAIATDAAGNQNTASVTVTFADPVPGVEQDLQDTQDQLNATEDALNIARDSQGSLQTLVYAQLGLLTVVGAIAVVSLLMYVRERRKGGSEERGGQL
ncbi:MAG: Ig-like domain-containing protein, partial [Thermoplasmata archaeon]